MTAPSAADWFFFDPREQELVIAVLEQVALASPDHAMMLDGALGRLASLAELVRDSPLSARPRGGVTLARSAAEALVQALCDVPEYDFELHIPTKAVIGQGYLIAKINFLKALAYTVAEIGADPALYDKLQLEIGQSLYSKLAEELFISILTDPEGSADVKLPASAMLLRIWEERLLTEVDDIAPLLESAWHARTRVRPVLGTMLGTHEIFMLFREAADERLLEYFGNDSVTSDEIAAFEEFIFGVSHEGITRLRSHLAERQLAVIRPDEARELLGPSEQAWPADEEGPQALYTSYKRRRVKAAYRALTHTPGPTKTAEEYVMIALLRSGFTG